MNYKYLCGEHHRGNKSPHRNRQIDRKYKIDLQGKLRGLLIKEYYSEGELVKILGLNKAQAKKICKKFLLFKEGHKRDEIICRIMGGRIYE